MGLETSTTLSGLQVTNPTSGDPVSQGDDHIRLIKSALKAQFPGSGGSGFSIPIAATEVEINYLAGVTSNIQSQLNVALSVIPAGTVMLFLQAAPPSGWELVTTWTGNMLRVVSTAGGASGGLHSPILMDKVPSHTHPITVNSGGTHTHSLTIDNNGNHSHTYDQPSNSATVVGTGVSGTITSITGGASTGTNGAHIHTGAADSGGTHTHTASSSTNSGASTWQPLYVDAIPCRKL